MQVVPRNCSKKWTLYLGSARVVRGEAKRSTDSSIGMRSGSGGRAPRAESVTRRVARLMMSVGGLVWYNRFITT